MNDDNDILKQFSQEVKANQERVFWLDMRLMPLIQIISQVQLALRHPRNNGPAAHMGEAFVKQVQQLLSEFPAVVDVIERGNNPENDVQWDNQYPTRDKPNLLAPKQWVSVSIDELTRSAAVSIFLQVDEEKPTQFILSNHGTWILADEHSQPERIRMIRWFGINHETDDLDEEMYCSKHQCEKNLVDYPDGSRYECPECQREDGEQLGLA